jgi:hypothetical protein
MRYSIYNRKTNQLVCRVVGKKNDWQITDNDSLAKALEPFKGQDLLPHIISLVDGQRVLIKDESIESEAQSDVPLISSEELSQRVEPAVKILKELLRRAEIKRNEIAQIEAHKQAMVLEQQNAQVLIDNDGQYYVTMDGDGIGNQVARAQFQDDEQKVKEISRRIDSGKDLFIQWATMFGGIIIEAGGDEGNARIPSAALEHIEEFRKNYEKQVGATVTVGVGKSISQSIQARELGKLRGKNQVVYWDDGTEKELSLRLQQKGEETAESKIRESGVLSVEPASQKLGQNPEAPKRQPRYMASAGEFQANQKTQQEYETWLQSQKREIAS